MSSTVLAVWEFAAQTNSRSVVLPDGCRDLIFRFTKIEGPRWFLTSLDTEARLVPAKSGDFLTGFRLKPGVSVRAGQLLESVRHHEIGQSGIEERIASFTSLSRDVVAALDCLRSDVFSVGEVVRRLGVSSRTLQRLLLPKTGRSPMFWLALARVRKAARAASRSICLAHTAADHGYADQAHMSREFRRWLGTSPAKMRADVELLSQLNQPGYAGSHRKTR